MKGQYFSFDAIVASVIFVLALVALLSYWHSVRSFLDFQSDALSKEAVKLSGTLYAPPGPNPSCNSIDRLGFANGWDDRRLNESVILCASAQDMEWLRETTGSSFNFSIRVENLADNSVISIGGPLDDANEISRIRRLATVEQADNTNYLAAIDISVYR